MKPLSEVAPGLLVIQIQCSVIWNGMSAIFKSKNLQVLYFIAMN